MKIEEDVQRWEGNGLVVSCAFQGSKWDGNNMRMLELSPTNSVLGLDSSGPREVKCNRVGRGGGRRWWQCYYSVWVGLKRMT